MGSPLRVRVVLLMVAAAIVAAVWGTAALQRAVADERADRTEQLDRLVTGVLHAHGAALAKDELGETYAREEYLVAREVIAEARAWAEESVENDDDAGKTAVLHRTVAAWDEAIAPLALGEGDPPEDASRRAESAQESVIAAAEGLRRAIAEDNDADQTRLTNLLGTVSLLVVLLVGGAGLTVVGRRDRERRRAGDRAAVLRERQAEMAAAMQVVDREEQTHGLLKRHVERLLPGSRATVLSRNNSDNRLEAKTEVPEDSPLAGRLADGVEPRACLATRSGTDHDRAAGEDPLVLCEICGDLPGGSACRPLIVSGEVIGAVQVSFDDVLQGDERAAIAETVAQAAPVLGNLRTLAIAETRAATDALTGLPNRRALQDTLKRFVAQSARSGEPVAALALDLDHFKQVNDRYGHEKGDEVLAAVGRTFADVLRESDFAARAGGEEFTVLLPATDHDGALLVAEKVREAVSRLEVPGVDREITASLGVASYPFHAFDAATLIRKADRALYMAKEQGRDRTILAAAPVAADAEA